jgi:hypothetical protein
MKNTILFYLLLNTCFLIAQSKKEQIETLKFRIDSLNTMITVERNSSNQNILNLNANISSLENHTKILNTEIEETKLEVKMLRESNSKKDMEIQIKANEIIGLLQTVRELKDSIKNTSQRIDTLIWEIPDITWNQIEFNIKLCLPVSKFYAPKGNLLVSRDSKIKICYDYNYTVWLDEDEGIPLFYSKKDAINYYSKNLQDLELTNEKIEGTLSNNDGFVIRGKNAANQLTLIKGIYDELESMQGREEGEPNWLWSNTLIIKVTADQTDEEEFNYISNLLINNFTPKSIIHKY